MSRRLLAVLSASALLLTACGSESPDAAEDPGSGGSSSESSAASESASSSTSGGACQYASDGQSPAKEVSPPPADPTVNGTVPVSIETSAGTLKATLDAGGTPCTVNSFVSLAEQGYFDGTSCHRLTTSGIFVLQCGDPTGSGMGGPGYSFEDELSGSEKYGAGTLAMANAGPNTNGSQFFIVYQDSSAGLQPLYNVFGQLDKKSLTTVQKLAKKGTETGQPDGAPKTPVEISGVTVG
ncbi:peptidylprolyl isomerase [Nocardioides rotundus]|uniref:peptidylprolyl isomerase n=1 Tax=Nocardioides rotundus TaxID=1774216 RepID=UPI002958C1C7|nr:peptidylprolyl isomerase [Nocardioides rotundus]UAL31406.1 peptidylprolyl isomerase [Nocardioides rotundus]